MMSRPTLRNANEQHLASDLRILSSHFGGISMPISLESSSGIIRSLNSPVFAHELEKVTQPITGES